MAAMAGKRVLHLGPLHSIHLRRSAELTREVGWEPHVAGHVQPGLAPVDFAGAADSVRTAPAPRPPFATPVRVAWLRRLARELQPDVVHAHGPASWGFVAALARLHPLVVAAWGSDVYLLQGRHRRFASFALRRADRALGPSPHLTRALSALGADPALCDHVDWGVDLERFRPLPGEEARAARERLGLGHGPVVFSFRGGYPIYNLPTVVEAFSLLRAQVPDARLLVAHGAVPIDPAVAEPLARLEREGAVVLLGNVPPERMTECYAAATVGISIPSSDGSPRSVWESLACELPLVLSDLPQLAERVAELPAVRLVPREPRAVADALAELVRLRENGVGRTGREWVAAHMDHRDHAARLRRVYEDLTGVAGRSSGAR